jgi:hypothetical protein
VAVTGYQELEDFQSTYRGVTPERYCKLRGGRIDLVILGRTANPRAIYGFVWVSTELKISDLHERELKTNENNAYVACSRTTRQAVGNTAGHA